MKHLLVKDIDFFRTVDLNKFSADKDLALFLCSVRLSQVYKELYIMCENGKINGVSLPSPKLAVYSRWQD